MCKYIRSTGTFNVMDVLKYYALMFSRFDELENFVLVVDSSTHIAL